MEKPSGVSILFAVALFLTGCASSRDRSEGPVELSVFAAASLQDVLRPVAAQYETSHQTKIVFNFASSNTLAQQILYGARADLFFSADEIQMNLVAEEGLLKDNSRVDLLSNRLVIIAPADSKTAVKEPRDLLDSRFRRLSLGDPQAVPVGVYARKYLEALGLWEELKKRVVPAPNTRAALALVASGAAEAGIVYQSDALMTDKVKILYQATEPAAPRICYPVAILRSSTQSDEAQQVLEFCRTPAAARIFERYGFILLDQGGTNE